MANLMKRFLCASVLKLNKQLLSTSASQMNYTAAFSSFKKSAPMLETSSCSLVQTVNFKTLVGIHRRCRDCRITRVDNRLAVLCETHPRHKQIQMGKKASKRLHKPYPWRWPDPFDKKYALHRFSEDRYLKAFEK